MSADRWLPFLGDAVAVETMWGETQGEVSRWDPSVVVMQRPQVEVPVIPGQRMRARWSVGAMQHEGEGQVEDVDASTYTVRLQRAAFDGPSRRTAPRIAMSLPVEVTQARCGSLGATASLGHSLDLSSSGMKAMFSPSANLAAGDVLEVVMEYGGRTERLLASVVWETGAANGDRVAGLKFREEIQVQAWAELALQQG